MKRRREEMEKGKSELRLAMEELSVLSSEGEKQQMQGSSTLHLLCASKKLLHVLDEIGPTLLVLRHDIQQNVDRLGGLHARDPCKYASLTEVVTEEVEQGTCKKTNSCTRAILWLARSLNFSMHLLEMVLKSPELSLQEAVEEAYRVALKPWHGWISSAAYKVALKLVPEREIFVSLLKGKGKDSEDFAGDAKNLASIVQPLLDHINAILGKYKLDKLKST